MRCWSSGFRVQQTGNGETVAFGKVDIPIYPERSECQRKVNAALQDAGGVVKEIELSPGEVYQTYVVLVIKVTKKCKFLTFFILCP